MNEQESDLEPWSGPVVVYNAIMLLFWVSLLWSSSITLNFATDYISDSYHVFMVQGFVDKAYRIQHDPKVLEQEKRKAIRTAVDQAHQHNKKILRRAPSNPEAIDELEVEYLRAR